jgi:hypothetical protein
MPSSIAVGEAWFAVNPRMKLVVPATYAITTQRMHRRSVARVERRSAGSGVRVEGGGGGAVGGDFAFVVASAEAVM